MALVHYFPRTASPPCHCSLRHAPYPRAATNAPTALAARRLASISTASHLCFPDFIPAPEISLSGTAARASLRGRGEGEGEQQSTPSRTLGFSG
ncbi:hypothetical protein E2C01_069928 [Portunus trituberculatus]|uniref:Uncharacterized protein n=1 Tax=Portunus trituberculatus TaxID=210409 RepID=A0A5B7I3S4_PORTR|nr:hypothetical protein [Portunus trituberculatus]